MDESEKFFHENEDEWITTHASLFSVEMMYQAFKARMMKELGLSEKVEDGDA